MASTTTQPNNATVKFRGRAEREVAKEMVPLQALELSGVDKPATAAKPFAGKTKKFPKGTRKIGRKLAKRGMISENAMKKHMGGY